MGRLIQKIHLILNLLRGRLVLKTFLRSFVKYKKIRKCNLKRSGEQYT
jgi:hypothetical protein